MPFQTTVNYQPSPGVVGAFCSANPRASVVAGAGAFIAGSAGATVGNFAWTDTATNSLISNSGQGLPRGFIANELQAMISEWMAESSLTIPEGRPVTLFNEGDFWMQSSTAGTVGDKIFASFIDGSVRTGASGTVFEDSSFTATLSGATLTVSAIASGSIVVGQLLSGTGVPANTYVTAQTGGTTGGAGTYTVSTSTGAVSTGESMTGTNSIETKWYCGSIEPANSLIKASSWGY